MARARKIPHGDDLITLIRGEPTLTTAQLQERFGVSQPAVSKACRKAGVVLARWGRPAVLPETASDAKSTPDQMAAEVARMYAADPSLTAKQIEDAFRVSSATAYRLVKRAGVELRNPIRTLPEDALLAEEIMTLGRGAVAAKYGIGYDRVCRHATRLKVPSYLGRPSKTRKLPPDEILRAELDVLSTSEIAERYDCSEEQVRKARVRLKGPIKPRVSHSPSVAAVPLMATAIKHLHAYRGILAAIDPQKATALLDDIEQLQSVATAIVTIAGVVAAPKRA